MEPAVYTTELDTKDSVYTELYVMLKIINNLFRWILIYYTQSSNLFLKACTMFPVFNVHLKTKFIACTS